MCGHHDAVKQATFLSCLCLIQHYRGEKSQPRISTKHARLKLGKSEYSEHLQYGHVWDLAPGSPLGGFSPEELAPHTLPLI